MKNDKSKTVWWVVLYFNLLIKKQTRVVPFHYMMDYNRNDGDASS